MKMRTIFERKEVMTIVVCGLLLALNLGAVGKKSRQHGRELVCQSNLSQWGLIFSLYAQDNEGKLPQSVPDEELSAQEAYWLGATLPYYRAKGLRFCPASKPDIDNDPEIYDWDDYGSTYEDWGPIGSITPDTFWAAEE